MLGTKGDAAPAAGRKADFNPDKLPPVLSLAAAAVLAAITLFHILALTPFTQNLDDIKYVSMWGGGGILLFLYSLLLLRGQATVPPSSVTVPYALFVVLNVVSTLLAEPYDHWAGWRVVVTLVACSGYFLMGCAVMRTVLIVRYGVRFWVFVAFLTCGFGLFHYGGAMERVLQALDDAKAAREENSAFYNLVATFAGAKAQMLSTILNTEFFGSFLLLVLPLCLAGFVLAIERIVDLRTRQDGAENSLFWPVVWLVMAGVDVIMALACAWLTYAKSCTYLLPFLVLFPIGLWLFTKFKPRIPHWPLILAGVLLVGATVAYFSAHDLAARYKTFGRSMTSREVMWKAAWGMFNSRPIFGWGPASYLNQFPNYRDPGFHLYDINNVTTYVHNTPLQLLAENGVVGLAAYLAFLGSIALLGFRALRKSPCHVMRVAIIGYLLGIALLYASNMAIPMQWWPIGQVLTYLTLGLATGAALTAQRGNMPAVPPATSHGGIARGLQFAFAGFAAYFCLYSIRLSDRHFHAAMENSLGVQDSSTAIEVVNRCRQLRAQADQVTSMMKSARSDAERKKMADQVSALRSEALEYEAEADRRTASAVEHFDRVIALSPTYITTYYKKAHTYNLMGRPADALRAYAELMKYSPDYSEVHYNLAVIYMNLMADGARYLKTEKDPVLAADVRRQYLQFRERALAEADRAAQLSSKIAVRYMRATVYKTVATQLRSEPTGYDEQEYKRLMRVAAAGFQEVGRLQYSVVLQDAQQLEDERKQREQAVRTAPQIYAELGDWKEAGDAYAEAYDTNRGDAGLLKSTLDCYVKAGALEKAYALVARVLERNPVAAEVLLLRAELMARTAKTPAEEKAARTEALVIREIEASHPGYLDANQKKRVQALVGKG